MQTTDIQHKRLTVLSSLMATVFLVAACGGGGGGGSAELGADAANADADDSVQVDANEEALATTWTKVADEWRYFTVKANSRVRFGAGTKWIEKTISGTTECKGNIFGGDPAPGVVKTCQVASDAASAPAPAPAPAPSPAPAPAPSPAPAPAPTVGTATLSWTATQSSAVNGYRVYYGKSSRSYQQAPGSGIKIGNTTTYTVSNLPKGSLYYFAVTAIDAAGNESPYSNEASKQVQ